MVGEIQPFFLRIGGEILELKDIKHIGPVLLDRFNCNQIYTPQDLLLHFPKKYTFYQVDNQNAFSGELLCFNAVITSRPVWIKTIKRSKAFVFYALVNGIKSKCIIFSGDYLRYKLQIGLPIICYGKYKNKEREFSLTTIFFEEFTHRIELDYGIPDINNKTIQNAVSRILDAQIEVEDDLPVELLEKYRMGSLLETAKLAHFPRDIMDCKQVWRRIRYEDFFWYTASLEALKQIRGKEQKTPKIINKDICISLISRLPYQLTPDQLHVLEECLRDLQSSKIMNRLIQGDVGSGKSIVAFLCAIMTIHSGCQVSLMAPTELLAMQHYENFKKLFPEYSVELLTSAIKEKDKADILYRLLHGRIQFIIGTHALIQERVVFKNLGCVIIDEQHRFGVNQRKALLEKFKGVDALYMTATPIPRTLGLTNFGDLDLSVIKTMPQNRKQVITKLLSMEDLSKLAKTLQRHIALEEQIYVVVPLITENELLDFIDIDKAYEIFSEMIPFAKIAKLHGKMKNKDKEAMMTAFKDHSIDCLIATTVIEVGIDVKNATVMVILDADRYGLSQIHQLRGRVGRGDTQSYCYLVSRKETTKRLQILEQTNDGFELAEEDFKLRGPGDYLGEEQSGFASLNFDFDSKDAMIWKCALEDSRAYVKKYLDGLVKNKKLDSIFKQISIKNTKIN